MDFGDGDLEDDGDKDNDDLHRVERWEGVRASSLADKRHLETTWIIIDLIDGNHDLYIIGAVCVSVSKSHYLLGKLTIFEMGKPFLRWENHFLDVKTIFEMGEPLLRWENHFLRWENHF